MQKSKGKLQYQVDELSRQNEILCADIAYIHKMGVGYGLENAKRQKAYEEARQKMEELRWRNWSNGPPTSVRWLPRTIEIPV